MAIGRIARFAGFELVLWTALYGAYLALRNVAMASEQEAFSNASALVDLERAAGLYHEVGLQRALLGLELDGFFSAYYMLGFGPLIASMLIWLALRHREAYRDLRTWLLVSIGIASIGYLFLPTAPPRLMDGLGFIDTVGLESHDTGSVGGIKFNPYAAMPSMHVGWSVLVGLIGMRVVRRRSLKVLFALHPAVMAITVTATGNHYFLDSIIGALVALTAVALVALRLPSRLLSWIRPLFAWRPSRSVRGRPAPAWVPAPALLSGLVARRSFTTGTIGCVPSFAGAVCSSS